ncbi:hypothetical protein SAMN05216358_0066 [Rhizobium sp. AN5]|uniref:hypothetical protein n=1 Tax=Rhizobium sp. AN5 TaxID=1855304 RepID=UPI000BC39A01|nr:hypothetical protein [Rhizobium sp. AN5]SOC90047.1 hypothetical protein SAMN05216358_0066 [Rhizobium sp. AN5]
MVNVPNIERVIASIKGELPETQTLGFNMNSYVDPVSLANPDLSGRDCEWTGCIAGHAYLLEIGCPFTQAESEDTEEIEEIAQHYLGLSREQADNLFFDLPAHLKLARLPASVAIETLERLAATGKVDWLGEKYVDAA